MMIHALHLIVLPTLLHLCHAADRTTNPWYDWESNGYSNIGIIVVGGNFKDIGGAIPREQVEDNGGLLKWEDVRFNKFEFKDPSDEPRGFRPLTSEDYPIGGIVSQTLRLSTADSVVTLDDYEVIYNVPRMIRRIGGLPSYPSSDERAPFWDEFREVIRIQKARRQNPSDVSFLPLPTRWLGADLNEIAEFVHDELPGSLQANLLFDIVSGQHGPVEVDKNAIPYRSNNDFLRTHVMLALLNGWAISEVGPHNFAAKWLAGRPRPEEVAWLIHQGAVQGGSGGLVGTPSDIEEDILSFNLTSAADFTAYSEGSPTHPAWPAMHAATGCTSFWLSVVMNLTPNQLCQAKLTDYNIAYARTVAGVHYPDDNIAGMNIAQEVLARSLPTFLQFKFNADPTYIARKIHQVKFDWAQFDPSNPCPM